MFRYHTVPYGTSSRCPLHRKSTASTSPNFKIPERKKFENSVNTHAHHHCQFAESLELFSSFSPFSFLASSRLNQDLRTHTMSNNDNALEATDNLAALIQDAKEFNKRPIVPVGNVRTDIGADDVSAISFQSSRSMKDKIRIVQDPSAAEVKTEDAMVVEDSSMSELRQTVEDWKDSSKKQWQGIQQNTSKAIDTVKVKSQEIIDEKIKPGWEKIGGASKDLVDTKLKPLWENTSDVARAVPAQTKATVLQMRDSSVKHYETHLSPKLGVFQEFHEKNSKYYLGKAPGVFETRDMSLLKYQLLEQTLLSIGMILQCENPVTGMVIITSILFGSPVVAISSLLTLISSLLFQRIYLPLTPPGNHRMWPIRAGANAFLAGAIMAALSYIPSPNPILSFLGKLVLCCLLGPTCLFVHSQLFPPASSTPPLLWSFNLVVGVLMLALGLRHPEALTPLALPATDDDEVRDLESYSLIRATLCGVSAIFGVPKVWIGILMLLGVGLCSRLLVAYLLLATSITSLLAFAVGMDAVKVNLGLAGSQAALTAAACAYYFQPSKHLLLVGAVTVVWTCILEAAVATVFYGLT